jgi:HAD superfamily hydrolase (TIGR01509 family)
MAFDQGATRVELAIFDCDGVLVDSEPTSNRVMADAISEAGLPIGAAEVAETFAGMRLDDILAAVEKRLGKALPADWLASFEARRVAEFERGLNPIPGAAEALERIADAGVALCVASQARLEKTRLTLSLTDLAGHFDPDALFSSRMVARGKPHPDLFLHAARSMGSDPARCVVVEDGVLGSRGARLAGMKALGYAPAGDGERLAREGATVFTSMSELPALLGLA